MAQRSQFGFLRIVLAAWFASLPVGAIDWQQENGYRRAPVALSSGEKSGFVQIPAASAGITFSNLLSDDRSLTNQIFLNGSGVAAGDIDGDGSCDLYFCGLDSPNVLYRNRGSWRFEDITGAAGVACADQASTGAVFADIDGDGDLDLLVTGIAHGARLFLNDGSGKFREVTDEAGLRSAHGSTSMALADIDGDGLLDLYVVNYRNDTMRDMPDLRFTVGVTNGISQLLSVNDRAATAPDLVGRFTFSKAGGVLENGEADILYRNLGNGHFAAVGWTNGTFIEEHGPLSHAPYDWGLSAMFRDMNQDGAPDLYVCNDFQSPDRIWMNDGRGHFRAIAKEAIRQTSLFSMGVDFADIDRDGFDDFFVADMLSREHAHRQVQILDPTAFSQVRNPADDRPQFSRNTLFRNRGNGTYAEVAQFAGIDASEWSWCPIFVDVDLDGYEDLLITTGHWRDAQNADVARELDSAKRQKSLSIQEQLSLRRRFPRLNTSNIAFRNRGDFTFEESGSVWGFGSQSISQGMALADLDNDGDLDVIINCLNAAPLIYESISTHPRIAVQLRGQTPNTRGVGTRVRVMAPGLPSQSQEFICGGRYLSSDDFRRTFAAGRETHSLTIEVTWRDGNRSWISNAQPNGIFEINESGSVGIGRSLSPSQVIPFFEDASSLLSHQHFDEPFDDFARQPLLPRKLSQLGPGLAWFDFNGDGWEDLFIGSGRGGKIAVFRNDERGKFIPQRAKAFEIPVDRDVTSILGWQMNPTNLVLLLGLANYEDAATNSPPFREFSIVNGLATEASLRSAASTGPLALGDIDGDGDLDLFLGGRVIAARYPEPASSFLFRNDHGRFVPDFNASKEFEAIGLVSSAVFTDLDADGLPELVLACEWGSVKIFHNERGAYVPWEVPLVWEATQPSRRCPRTLKELTGWWNSVASGDLDGDGRLDLIVGNWGNNTAERRFSQQPIRLLFGEGRDEGPVALLECRFDPGLRKWVPARDWGALSSTFPFLRDRYMSYDSFSTASIDDLATAGLARMKEVAVETLDSLLMLNRGDHFDVRPLTPEAQLSPVFGIAIADLDGDGDEDAILGQNFSGVSPFASRQDAGCGLWLRNSGHGDLTPVSPMESGIAFFGDARGVALCDFDHDGRLDFVVGQNGGATKLYRNLGAHPGIRVHLEGPPENRQAVGAVVQLVSRDGRLGSAHEIQLGGGYWSQNSREPVLGFHEEPQAIQIRWPGGKVERVGIPAGARLVSRTMPVAADPR